MCFAYPEPPPSDESGGKLKYDQKRKHDSAPTEGAKGRSTGEREKGGREGNPRVAVLLTAKEKCEPQSTLPSRLFSRQESCSSWGDIFMLIKQCTIKNLSAL